MDMIISILTGLFLLGGCAGIIAIFIVLISQWPIFIGVATILVLGFLVCWIFGEVVRGRL